MNTATLHKDTKALGETLLEISILLMVSGASTERVRTTVDRISSRFELTTYILVSQRTIIISIYNDVNECVFNSFKRTLAHTTNFSTVSEISRISWLIVEEKWSVQRIHNELVKLSAIPHYPRLMVLGLTGLAGASFCRLANGGMTDMAFVFLGTFAGLLVRQETSRMRFNPYVCVYFSALCASLVAGCLIRLDPQINHEAAFVTSVLFLIPGIPLINAFSDMIDGNIQNGLIRGLHGFIVSFFIALGLLTSMAIYRF
ncbi:hypothetical protein PBAL39_01857 [Pedobacter sp. BAL39]|uniref:threonine/serine ThrE exporter family protein n=1 Tax=Pedobacter sp. BAL39 TaxID=391596 RepID=UPI0001559A91|nr:threonine/serine exporter family protein [Pedobacter sp. BAL39]EDM38320.1 hypothetical protein PBAL39_01857 [Pedobacter sp. BAL39]